MSRKDNTTEELLARDQAKGYAYGAHRMEDSARSSKIYTQKTIRDQDGALKLYEK
jgi:hypothetical protein